MQDAFVHLHLHTEYSMLDGAAKISPLLKEVERHEMPAVAMTDHGNMFGAFEMWSKAKDTAVRPILGIEAYVAPESRHVKKQVFWGASAQRDTDLAGEGGDVAGGGRFTHMTMLARNATGLRNLFKISSLASMEGFYGKPRMDQELIAQNPEGIIATTGCPSGEVQTRLRLGQFDKARQAAARYRDIFGAENYFVELMDHGLSIERSVREGLLTISRELGLRPVATNDSHYVTEDQADAHDVLLCIGTGKNREDTNRLKFAGTGYYIKPAAEMRAYWDTEVPGACDSTLLIAEMVAPGCYDEVFDFTDRMPQFPVPQGQTQASWLRGEVAKGVARRFGDHPGQDVLDRIELELGLMEQLGFSAYFLIVGDICRYARENGIRVGPGRGSATGSMVAYVLGITDLDPIEHQLLFERFLNPERVSPPDIDLDFDERRRGDIIRYVTGKYGEPSVAQVLTFGTIKAKAAIKDSSRVLGYPFAMGERITKALPPAVMGKDIPLYGIFDDKHERYGEAAEIRDLYTSDTEVRKIIDTARGIEGLTRGSGVHACAVIIGSQPLIDIIPVHKRDTDGAIITGFPYPDCEAMGLLKMDFLGLRNLTMIDDAVRNVKSNRGIDIDLDSMPLADDKTFELLARGDTLGVFQLDGGPMRNLLRLMAPTKFGDIAAVLALYRPGPMAANAHIDYADRKNNRKVVAPIHPDLAEVLQPILGETYGLVVYQEQVMSIARTLAGYSLGGADLLRRAMGKKKEILDKEYERFSAGMTANGYSASATKAVWDVLVPFSGYGFNKSHTAGYGIVSFWTAYLKANYPAEYMAALLTSVGDDKDKSALYLSECRRMGIKVLPPDVNASNAIFTSVGTDIRFGLAAIRNVGGAVVEAIVAARTAEGSFTSFSDFLRKVPAQVCNKRVIESLIKAGAFDSLGSPRRGMLMIHEQAIDAVIGAKREAERGQDSLFDDDIDNAVIFDVPVPDGEWDKSTLLGFEREMLGLYVSDHPLRGLEHVLAAESDCSVMQLLAAVEEPERQGRGDRGDRDGQVVTLGGILSGVQRKVTRQGNPWAAASLEDLEGAIEVMFFPATYQACMHLVAEDAIVAVKGRLDRREDTAKLIAMEVRPIELPAEGNGPFLVSMLESRCVPDIVDRLRDVLRTHPGAIEVHLRLLSGARSKVLKLDDKLRVRPTPSLVADLKQLLGPTCVG